MRCSSLFQVFDWVTNNDKKKRSSHEASSNNNRRSSLNANTDSSCSSSEYAVKLGNKIVPYVCPDLPFWPATGFVAFLASTCFILSLEGAFVFDDTEAILHNEDVKSKTWEFLFNDFWGTSLLHKSSHKSYRPLTILSFRLNYILDGGTFNAGLYHLTNLILHSTCSALSVAAFCFITGEIRPRLSFISAVIFSIHPVHTEAVAGIVGRADLLCGCFYFLSIFCYVKHLKTGGQSWGLFTSSMMCCAIAMLCKEQGITVLGVLAVYDLITSGRLNLNNKKPRSRLVNMKSIAVRFLWMTLVGLALLYCRFTIMGSTTPAFQRVDNPASFDPHLSTRTLTYHYVYSLHALLLLWPHWLCFDWSMGCVPLVHTLTDPRNFASVILWSILLSAIFKALFSSSSRQRRYLTLGLALMGVPFLPATNLFFRVGFVVAERVLFIPVAGYSLIFVYGLERLNYKLPNCNKLWRFCLFAVLLIYGLKSARRSVDWQDERILFRTGLSVCPLNAKVHYNIGKNLADGGDRDSAIASYKTALELNPSYDQAMNNLANLLKDAGRLESAEYWLQEAIKVRPDFAAAWMNLGIVQALLAKHQEARISYITALNHRRKYPDCYYNLGNLYLELERYQEAGEAFRNAALLQPGHVLAWTNLIVMLDNTGQSDRSEATAIEALKLLPNEANLHFSLAGILGKQNRFEESERYFLSAIRLQPASAIYHTNLGVLYHRWKKFELAERFYRQALTFDPHWKSAVENLKLLLKNRNISNKRLPGNQKTSSSI